LLPAVIQGNRFSVEQLLIDAQHPSSAGFVPEEAIANRPQMHGFILGFPVVQHIGFHQRIHPKVLHPWGNLERFGWSLIGNLSDQLTELLRQKWLSTRPIKNPLKGCDWLFDNRLQADRQRSDFIRGESL